MKIISFKKIKKNIFPSQKVFLIFMDSMHQFSFNTVVHSVLEDTIVVLNKSNDNIFYPCLKKQFLLIFKKEKSFYGTLVFCQNFIINDSFVKIFLVPIPLTNRRFLKRKEALFFSERKHFVLCLFKCFKKNRFKAEHFLESSFLSVVDQNGFCIQSNQESFVGNYVYLLNFLSDAYDSNHACIILWKIKNTCNNSFFQYTYRLRFINKNSHIFKNICAVTLKNIFYNNFLQ